MKPITQKHFFDLHNNNKPPLQWRRLSDFLKALLLSSEYWSLGQLFPGACLSLARMKNLSLQWIHRVPAGKVHVFLAQMNLAISATSNIRIYSGLMMIGIVTPLSACLYLIFDRSVVIEGWYHQNFFYLFMLLGPYLAYFFGTIGVFLLFPQGVKRAYVLVLPLGLTIGKILWLVSTTSNEQYWQIPHWSYSVYGLLIALFFMLTIDYLVWRKCHREDAFRSRYASLESVVNDEDISDEKFRSLYRQNFMQKKSFEKQF